MVFFYTLDGLLISEKGSKNEGKKISIQCADVSARNSS